MYSDKLPLNEKKIARCRKIAADIGQEVANLIHRNSTVGTERGILRLLGFNGALTHQGLQYPVANLMLDQLREHERLQEGALFWVANALLAENVSIPQLEEQIATRKLNLGEIKTQDKTKVVKLAKTLAQDSFKRLKSYRELRRKLLKKQGDPLGEKRPLKYVIVATGNIFEDVTQAKSAVMDGADIIAVIRSTAQSLLDYVPHGTTTEGFGGTYATQGNFRVMREALDEIGEKEGRYIRLTNYCSGLCMSEIAALASLEGLDCLLNDAMYGILFRDINPRRTLIDQHFSRLICSVSDIWIMTGEDNYMKTTDAVKAGDQVLASQFINEVSALNAGMRREQMSIGHAMEMDPAYEKVILMEIARAQMTRQIFPKAPLKYMCATKYKTGDIFTAHALDTVFNLIGSMTNQGVILLGMPTEAVHTPWMQDRSLAIRDANYILNGSLGLSQEFGFNSNGFISKFAQKVLDDCLKLLEKINREGFFKAIDMMGGF
ncbi:MAG: D-lysine 5,6-aminomutase subunit alpha [Proteobacteria bacterium]|nr:D-lysine 5,6-aminomutase subunit alpha [Pseudomonadota bacterium]NDD03680.1 D-lysine 5,6-aminomutase subunit alpha [Pseudomonadota bacterium]